MGQQLEIPAFLEKQAQAWPIFDARSPSEFAKAHLPGAISFPLFDDAERAQIGKIYKESGKQKAVTLGLEMVGPRLATWVKRMRKLAPGGQLLLHCWRGGMRSGSLAWLFETAGFEVGILKGGYKAYRQEVLGFLQQPFPLRVLGGKTGSGKSALLETLQAQGHQVLDLEGLANHRGSAFGHLGLQAQPSCEQFENKLFSVLRHLDLSLPIWVEDESRHIGKVYLPGAFFEQLRQAPVYFMDIPAETRLPYLVEVYAKYPKEDLQAALDKIKKRLGGQWHQLATQALAEDDFIAVARITLHYYDKAYLHGLSLRSRDQVHPLAIDSMDPQVQYQALFAYLQSQKP